MFRDERRLTQRITQIIWVKMNKYNCKVDEIYLDSDLRRFTQTAWRELLTTSSTFLMLLILKTTKQLTMNKGENTV